MPEDLDAVFKALADPSRRRILDELRDTDGLSVTEIAALLPQMTRFGVMKHLGVLEQAALVVTRKDGRRTLHHLNPVPIALVADRWLQPYREHHAASLIALKRVLEERP